MKRIKLIFASVLLSAIADAQNLPQCDSLTITCCTFDTLGANTLTIYVSNPTTVLFDYPGFVLFNAAMDTVAKEQVTYFGISTGPQPHTMEIISPLNLPFNGYLNLYILFYDMLTCSFPFSIPDTTQGVFHKENIAEIKIYPNPAEDELIIEQGEFSVENNFFIFDLCGKEIYSTHFHHSPLKIPVNELSSGFYFVRITSSDSHWQFNRKIIVRRD
jgi:hypothetical protein